MVRTAPKLYFGQRLTVVRRILFFPFGNNVDHASLYLEQANTEKPPEGWYCCVQFVLVLWNKTDPTIYTHHGLFPESARRTWHLIWLPSCES